MTVRLVDRAPTVAPQALIAGLVPPPLFSQVSLSSYVSDPSEPTQQAAVTRVSSFAAVLEAAPTRGGLLRKRAADRPLGIYLDGGFGVGKTHLLASLWRAAP